MLGKARVTTVEALLRDLASPDARVRITAADAASSVVEHDAVERGRARVISALVSRLEDVHADVRAASALALADLGANEALPNLLVAADDDLALVRQCAITALGEIGDVRARERLRRALKDERPEVRFQAIVAFPRLAREADGKDEDAWSALSSGLTDDDAQVRGRAAEACGELADGAPLPDEIADLLATLVDDKDEAPDTRVAAAIALAESSDRRGGPLLLALLRGDVVEPNPGRVQAAFELAGALALEGARELAASAAFGLRARFGDPGRRAAALTALVRLGDRRAIEHVLAELDGRSFSRRAMAIGIASRGALAEARSRLLALKRDPTLADPDSVDDALARIDAEHKTQAP
jgi:HEAT repeat protein